MASKRYHTACESAYKSPQEMLRRVVWSVSHLSCRVNRNIMLYSWIFCCSWSAAFGTHCSWRKKIFCLLVKVFAEVWGKSFTWREPMLPAGPSMVQSTKAQQCQQSWSSVAFWEPGLRLLSPLNKLNIFTWMQNLQCVLSLFYSAVSVVAPLKSWPQGKVSEKAKERAVR